MSCKGSALRWKGHPEQRQRIQMVLLRESGMTQSAIAEAMGVSLSTALGVEPFEVAEQQQPEVPARRQTGPPHHGRVECLTLRLGKPLEAGLVEDGVQPRVERMARRNRQVGGRNPHRSLLARAFSHRHGPQCTVPPTLLAMDLSQLSPRAAKP
jgi:Homeodomain-like domain-containing protein